MTYPAKKYRAFKAYLGANIRIHREDNGLTIEELSAATILKPDKIVMLEQGKGNLSLSMLLRIACSLEIEPYMLLEDIYAKNEKGESICLSHFSACRG